LISTVLLRHVCFLIDAGAEEDGDDGDALAFAEEAEREVCPRGGATALIRLTLPYSDDGVIGRGGDSRFVQDDGGDCSEDSHEETITDDQGDENIENTVGLSEAGLTSPSSSAQHGR